MIRINLKWNIRLRIIEILCLSIIVAFAYPASAKSNCLNDLKKLVAGVEYDFPVRSELVKVPDWFLPNFHKSTRYHHGEKELRVYKHGNQTLTLGNKHFKSKNSGVSWQVFKPQSPSKYMSIKREMKKAAIKFAKKFTQAKCLENYIYEGFTVRLVEGEITRDKPTRHEIRRYLLDQETNFLLRTEFIIKSKNRVEKWIRVYSPAKVYKFPSPY